jgi:large subunit ribosomal protein L2
MAIKKFKPTSPGRRFQSVEDRSGIAPNKPLKKLTEGLNKSGGRNNSGRTTVWQRGGGHKRRYRVIDFRRDKPGVAARVESIEYDPNRTSYIARVVYTDGERRYILAPHGLAVGDTLMSGPGSEIEVGHAMSLEMMPLGTQVHNIELKPGKGGQMWRAAGTSAPLMAKEGKHALLRLPSGELRKVLARCMATVGEVSNGEHSNVKIGKAGRNRWRGRRPVVRGTAMNPVDHPHGGGEGRNKGRHPVTPWGKPTRGTKTRRNKRSNKLIVARRNKGK